MSDILLIGTGRSGTTWVQESLDYNNDFRMLFEPFHPVRSQYWKRTEASIYSVSFDMNSMKNILTGNIKEGNWINRKRKPIIRNRLLIKSIRIQPVIYRIQELYPKMKFIYIVRDPFFAASSPVIGTSGWIDTYEDIKECMKSATLTDDQREILTRANNPCKIGIARWIIDNFTLLERVDRRNTISVFYESLLKNGYSEFKRLADFCEIDFDKKDEGILKINSSTKSTRKRDEISKENIEYGTRALKAFNLDMMYKGFGVPAFFQPLDILDTDFRERMKGTTFYY